MGYEAQCVMRIAGKAIPGRLQHESDALIFRFPDGRQVIPISAISKVEVREGALLVDANRQTYVFELGTASARWAQRLLHPKSLLDKLGVKEGAVVALVGHAYDEVLAVLSAVGPNMHRRIAARQEYDWIFASIKQASELALLERLRPAVKQSGAIWVIFPKGIPTLRAADLIATAKANGLVDTKVARVSERLTAMKFVIPTKHRK